MEELSLLSLGVVANERTANNVLIINIILLRSHYPVAKKKMSSIILISTGVVFDSKIYFAVMVAKIRFPSYGERYLRVTNLVKTSGSNSVVEIFDFY